MARRITVLGATGSIGDSAMDLVARDPAAWAVVALTGGRNVALLAERARASGAALAVTAHEDALPELRRALAGSDVEAAAGARALEEAAARPADIVLNGIVGAAGLAPSLAALRAGATLALANKESLVAAGPLVMATARRHRAAVLPVDSEHSAVFQALAGEDPGAVERVVITASGGAFRDWPIERLAHATVADASCHPNWAMGQRITVDSASMFNKALELIETREYFGVDPARIEVVIHPESLIHALVGFHDGALMAHLGPPTCATRSATRWPGPTARPCPSSGSTSRGSPRSPSARPTSGAGPRCASRARSWPRAGTRARPSTPPRRPRSTRSSRGPSASRPWPRWSSGPWADWPRTMPS